MLFVPGSHYESISYVIRCSPVYGTYLRRTIALWLLTVGTILTVNTLD